jgi:O-antigen/teichoic acid export membrane protein
MPSDKKRTAALKALLLNLGNFDDAVKSVSKNFGWLMASRGVGAIFSLIYLAVITRNLGVEDFGSFALITGAAQFLSILLTFETWQVIVQYGVHHLEHGDEDRLARLYRWTVLLDLLSAVAGAVLAAIILHFFAAELGLKPTLSRATLIFIVIMLISLRSVPIGIMRLRNRYELAAAAESATPTMRLIGTVAVWFIHPTLQGFLIAWALAEVLTAVAHWIAVRTTGDLRLMFHNGWKIRGVLSDNPGIVRFAFNSSLTRSLGMSTKFIPLFLVGAMGGTAAAGAFRLAAQLSRSLTILSQQIVRAAFPEIVRTMRNQGVGGLIAMVMQTLRVSSLIGALVFVIVVLFGKFVLEFVGGADFGTGYYSLLWLSAAACVELAIVVFEPSIMAAGRANLAFYARLVGTAAMIGGALWLEPLMGAEGVAAAVLGYSAMQTLLLSLILVWMSRKHDNRGQESR